MSVTPRSMNFEQWYRNHILARVAFPLYWLAWLTVPFLWVLRRLFFDAPPSQTKLAVESGIKGWELLEYQELYTSACEYLGHDAVEKVAIDSTMSYCGQVREAIERIKPTHYFYDPRTSSEHYLRGTLESFSIFILLFLRGITPIVSLTDLSYRRLRTKASIVSTSSGIVNNFIAPRTIYPIFPHRRLIGPSLMPFSIETLHKITAQPEFMNPDLPASTVFVGALYEPRRTQLYQMKEVLEKRGINFNIKGREIGERRSSNLEYLTNIMKSAIVFTTSGQGIHVNNELDWSWCAHVVYRYLEATACGTLLIAPEVPGIRRFFTPNLHFVAFHSQEEAIERIEYYTRNDEERKRIALAGHKRAQELIESQTFWRSIDVALGRESLL